MHVRTTAVVNYRFRLFCVIDLVMDILVLSLKRLVRIKRNKMWMHLVPERLRGGDVLIRKLPLESSR